VARLWQALGVPRVLDARIPYPQRFRRLVSGVARASQPSCLRLYHPSNASCRRGTSCSALGRPTRRLLWPRLTSGHPSLRLPALLAFTAGDQISQGKARDFRPIYPPRLHMSGPDGIGLQVSLHPRPPGRRLIRGSCSSGQGFAFSFLPTPPRGGRSCCLARGSCHLRPPEDFHLQVTSRSAFARRLAAPGRRCAPCLAHKEGRRRGGIPRRRREAAGLRQQRQATPR